MSKKQSNRFNDLFSNPVFLLVAFILIFVALFYFFGKSADNGGNGATDFIKEDGKVVITEYGDYECPACINEHFVVKQIVSEYKDKVVLDYRHFPLSFHKFAMKAAIAAECARDQGKFNEMHNALYEGRGALSEADLKKYAGNIGLNMDTFNACFDNNNHRDVIDRDTKRGEQDKISGTPTFYVNGRLLVNSENNRLLPRPEDFKREIDLELNGAK